jgi:hypothetical protein
MFTNDELKAIKDFIEVGIDNCEMNFEDHGTGDVGLCYGH